MPYWTKFIIKFDISYQKRRLHFLIQELNNQYSINPEHVDELDACKMAIYKTLELIKEDQIIGRYTDEKKTEIKEIINNIIELPVDNDINCPENIQHVTNYNDDFERLASILSSNLNLDKIRLEADRLVTTQLNNNWHDSFKRNLITNYLGFAFWDVITYSINGAKAVGEFNEILVNRISPNDDLILKSDPLEMPLKGTAMKSFGAFFSREDRENDYLWGRLNGTERLIDLLYLQAKSEGVDHKIDIIEIKKKAFNAILKAEEEHLHEVPDLFQRIKNRIDAL